MQNMATEVLTMLANMSNCLIHLMGYEEHPYENDMTADCILEKKEGHRTRDISVHIKPRPTIRTGNDCYLFVNRNEWYPCQIISLMTEEVDDIAIKKDAEKSKQSFHPLKQLEESKDHDVKRNGRNRQELGGE